MWDIGLNNNKQHKKNKSQKGLWPKKGDNLEMKTIIGFYFDC